MAPQPRQGQGGRRCGDSQGRDAAGTLGTPQPAGSPLLYIWAQRGENEGSWNGKGKRGIQNEAEPREGGNIFFFPLGVCSTAFLCFSVY